MPNKAILINAKEGTVSEVEIGDYTDIYKVAGFDCFTCVGLGKGETVYVDDEGLVNGTDYGFRIEGYPDPIMGNGVILGTSPNGNSKDTALTVADVIAKVKVIRWTPIGFVGMKPVAA